ncbi:aminoglycoside phosphotransferase family protein, partial [Pseudomonas aeruginosa]
MFMPPVFPAHWHVSQPVLIADTFSSLVWKVSLPDGTPAIVKGLKPIEDIADELRGADYGVWGAMEPKTNVSSESHRKGAFRSPA